MKIVFYYIFRSEKRNSKCIIMHKMYKKCWLKLTSSKFAVDSDRPVDSVLHENLLFPLGPEFMTQSSTWMQTCD